jgi:predicted nucleotidyltransferase component of viral defense system
MFHLSTVDPETFSLLKDVFKVPFIKKQFALAGGTSLALQIGHRKSIDLDFFSEKSFLPMDVEILLAEVGSWHYEPTARSERMLFCYINKIKCDFVNEPFPVIKPLVEEEGIKLYSIAGIAAMKMHTICGRGKKKDFIDIYALLQNFEWITMLEWFTLKYGPSQLFFLMKSITYFTDAEEDVDIRCLAPYDAPWEQIKKEIMAKCR